MKRPISRNKTCENIDGPNETGKEILPEIYQCPIFCFTELCQGIHFCVCMGCLFVYINLILDTTCCY